MRNRRTVSKKTQQKTKLTFNDRQPTNDLKRGPKLSPAAGFILLKMPFLLERSEKVGVLVTFTNEKHDFVKEKCHSVNKMLIFKGAKSQKFPPGGGLQRKKNPPAAA